MQGQSPYPPYNPYPTYPFCPVCPWEDEKERDQRRFKELYPTLARQIQPLVEDECDRMEYDGSFMFDEYPDQLQLRRVSRRIYDKVDKKDYQDDLMMQETNGRNWMEDFVTMMLLNEMYQRRCRRRDRQCNRMY
jgi:hypothetical protein